ncbi:unnamed protein product [Absidia cylindrospora]
MSMDMDTPALQFNEQLVGTKAIKVDVLTRRLTVLHKELQSFEQTQVDCSSLTWVSKNLIHKKIIHHSNSTVTALASCCLADILRLFAPEAPYDQRELKLIFDAFISQLGDLDKNNSTDFQYHFYLLESLSTVKSILIMADLDQAEDMTTQLFIQCFDTVEKRLPQNVQVCMTDILAQLVEEVPLSQEAVELVLEQLAAEDRATNTKHSMALDLCRMTSDTLQRRVCQYFTETLMTVSHSGKEGMEGLERVHSWIQKIYCVIPSLLLNVIPQLQEELGLDELDVRQLAMETIGNMFVDKSSALFRQYPSIWKAWLDRRRDKSVAIRARWVELGCLIYQNHSGMIAKEMNDFLINLLTDQDEKVRASVCAAIGKMGIETIIGYMSKSVLKQLLMRCKDRKGVVQKEALHAAGTIYNQIYTQLNDSKIMTNFGWIPCELFHCLLVGNRRLEVLLDDALQTHIFPEIMDDAARAERFVTVFMSFDEKAKIAFYSYIANGKRNIEMLENFIEFCDNDGTDSTLSEYDQSQAERVMKMIAGQFEDHARVISSLKQLRDMDDLDLVRSLRTSISVEKEYKNVVTAQKSLLKRLEQKAHGALEPWRWLLNRTHLLVVNKSVVPYLYSALRSTRGNRQSSVQDRSDASQTLAKKIGTEFPRMCISYADDLIRNIMNDNGGSIADISLEILASTIKSLPTELTLRSNILTRLSSYASNGSILQANNATTILCNSDDSETTCTDLLDSLIDDANLENPNLLTTLTSLSVIAKYSPSLLRSHVDIVVDFVQQKCMAQKVLISNPDNNPEWDEYDDLREISKQKLAAVPILTNYLIGMADTKQTVDDDIALTIVSMLWELVDTTCDIAVADKTSAAESSHLRLFGATSIIQLGEYPAYQHFLDVSRFEQLGLLLQDSCYYVRSRFGEYLMHGLAKAEINPRYQILLFLCAHEPEEAYIHKVTNFIRGRITQKIRGSQADFPFEFSIDRLIHLLAHHPDFGSTDDELYIFSQYIEFFISCYATQENITLLYYYVQRIKLSRDALSEDDTQNSHILCELAGLLLERRAKRTGWQIESGRHVTKLQSKLYKPLDVVHQKQALETSYISQELTTRIQNEEPKKKMEKRIRGDDGALNASKKTKRT